MTEMQNYTDETAQTTLSIKSMRDATVIMLGPTGGDDEHVLMLPTLALLAMIDRTSPDAMCGYLRERSDYLDSPYDLRDAVPEWPATDEPEQIDAVPEAESPDDVDEHPDAGSRLYAFQHVAAVLPRDALVEELLDAADWVHSGVRVHTLGAVEPAEVNEPTIKAWRAFTDAVREGRFGADR